MSARDVLDLAAAIESDPTLRGLLERALDVEQASHEEWWTGVLWHEVAAAPLTLNRLVTRGVVKVTTQSRKYTHYRLVDAAAVREALRLATAGSRTEVAADAGPAELPSD